MSGFEGRLMEAARVYHDQLMQAEVDEERESELQALGVMSYLDEHNLDFDLAIPKYRLGYVRDPLPGDEDFRGSICFPYLTRSGVVSMKFRMFGGKIKFHQPDGQEPRPYNAAAYFSGLSYVGLAEGEVDAICATEFLNIPTLGLPGSDSWLGKREIWGPLIKDNFRLVFAFGDGDDSGDKMNKALAKDLKKRVRKIKLPDGYDVCRMVREGRQQELLDQCRYLEEK